jgi:hypothetical protein
VRCQHPFRQGHLGTLKDGANGDGELLAAIAALKQAGAMLCTLKALALINTAAMRADDTIGPTLRFHIGAGGVVVVEDGV